MKLNIGELMFMRAVCSTHPGGEESEWFDPYDAWCWANRERAFRS